MRVLAGYVRLNNRILNEGFRHQIQIFTKPYMSQANLPPKILIIDDHPLIIHGLKLLFKTERPDINILTATNINDGVASYKEQRPDVCIVDYKLVGTTGLELTKAIIKLDSEAKLIMFTMFDSVPVALNFIRLGGKGFLVKDSQVDEIIQCVITVSNEDYYFNSSHEKELYRWIKEGLQNIPKLEFSERELEVCFRISKGLTNREIASDLGITIRTVDTYRQRLFEKAGVKNAPELIEYMYKNGIQELRLN